MLATSAKHTDEDDSILSNHNQGGHESRSMTQMCSEFEIQLISYRPSMDPVILKCSSVFGLN